MGSRELERGKHATWHTILNKGYYEEDLRVKHGLAPCNDRVSVLVRIHFPLLPVLKGLKWIQLKMIFPSITHYPRTSLRFAIYFLTQHFIFSNQIFFPDTNHITPSQSLTINHHSLLGEMFMTDHQRGLYNFLSIQRKSVVFEDRRGVCESSDTTTTNYCENFRRYTVFSWNMHENYCTS